jgi:trans-aconitate methyltransferase
MTDLTLQQWNADQYAANARYVSDLGQPVVDLLAPRAGERILDLGCGDGALSATLAALGCEVVGVDASASMVAAARAMGLDARVMSGDALAFEEEFDAVFSNAALHWMTRATAVVDGVWRALRGGGRFVGEFGGRGNVAGICAALNTARARRDLPALAPWFYPGPEEYRGMLEERGFRVDTMRHFPRPTPLPGPLRTWIDMFAGAFVAGLAPDLANTIKEEAVEILGPTHLDAGGVWHVDYVRLRFAARKS